jgi:hypothetical protein
MKMNNKTTEIIDQEKYGKKIITQDDNPDTGKLRMKRLKWNNRAIHRDLGYFYLGLIISFSVSGIMLNHRLDWHLDQYTVGTREIRLDLKQNLQGRQVTDTAAKHQGVLNDEGVGNKRRHSGRHGGPGSMRQDISGNPQGEPVVIPETFAEDFAKQFGIRD